MDGRQVDVTGRSWGRERKERGIVFDLKVMIGVITAVRRLAAVGEETRPGGASGVVAGARPTTPSPCIDQPTSGLLPRRPRPAPPRGDATRSE